MDYSYNYGFLRKFMEDHRLQKKDLLEALCSCDYVSLNKWLCGKVPIHITAMLRICNYYNISVANFFVDADGLPCDFAPTLPTYPPKIPNNYLRTNTVWREAQATVLWRRTSPHAI